jgi:hypothetical protein
MADAAGRGQGWGSADAFLDADLLGHMSENRDFVDMCI